MTVMSKMDNLTTYNGGKNGSGTYQQIINLMPPHDIYIEGFLGSGAILRRKKTARIANIGFDIDRSVTEQYPGTPVNGYTSIINLDVIPFLKNFPVWNLFLKKMGTSCFIYLDPPYLMETRSSQNKLYNHEMTVQDHERLLEAICSIQNSYVMISAYENDLYNKVLANWHTHSFKSQTRNGITSGTSIRCGT